MRDTHAQRCTTPPKPESFEKHLRFGCGFIVGALAACFGLAPHLTEFPVTFVASVSILANLSGILVMFCGARFCRSPSR